MKYQYVESLRSSLNQLPKKSVRERELSEREVMHELAKDFERLRNKGYSYEEIAAYLEKHGLAVKPGTVEYSIKKRRKVKRKSVSATAPKPKAIEQTEVPAKTQRKATKPVESGAFNPLGNDSESL